MTLDFAKNYLNPFYDYSQYILQTIGYEDSLEQVSSIMNSYNRRELYGLYEIIDYSQRGTLLSRLLKESNKEKILVSYISKMFLEIMVNYKIDIWTNIDSYELLLRSCGILTLEELVLYNSSENLDLFNISLMTQLLSQDSSLRSCIKVLLEFYKPL